MLVFKSAKRDPSSPHVTTAVYELSHSIPGRQGTTLSLDVHLEMAFGRTKAQVLDLRPEVEGENPEAALDKLADWLERSAKALRERGKPHPLFSNYPQT